MAIVGSKYDQLELQMIAEFLSQAREVLLENTARVEKKFEKKPGP